MPFSYSELVKEMLQDVRAEKQREHKPVDCPPEVSRMADIVGVAPCHIPAVEKVQRREDEPRNRDGNKVDVDTHLRLEEDAGKEDGRYRSRRTHGAVTPVVPVLEEVPEGGHDDGRQIEDHIEDLPEGLTPDGHEVLLHYPAEEIQGEHIEEEVSPSAVDEPVGHKLPPLPAVPYIVGAELQLVKVQAAIEAQDAYGCSEDDNDDGYHDCKDTQLP